MEGNHQIAPFPLRLPRELKDWLKHRAIDNHRSLNSEIQHRLSQSQKLESKEAA